MAKRWRRSTIISMRWVCIAFSPDGLRLLTASEDRTAGLWSADSSRLLGKLEHEAALSHAEFASDGHRILTVIRGSARGIAVVWNTAASGELVAKLEGHTEGISMWRSHPTVSGL